MTRIPLHSAERRTLDAWDNVLAYDTAFGFGPIGPQSRASEWGKVERDGSETPRLEIVVPDGLDARLKTARGETWLCLYDGHELLIDMMAPREAYEAALKGKWGFALAPLESGSAPIHGPGPGDEP